jgi:hypothetical protein
MASCDTADQLSKWLVLLLHEAADNLWYKIKSTLFKTRSSSAYWTFSN